VLLSNISFHDIWCFVCVIYNITQVVLTQCCKVVSFSTLRYTLVTMTWNAIAVYKTLRWLTWLLQSANCSSVRICRDCSSTHRPWSTSSNVRSVRSFPLIAFGKSVVIMCQHLHTRPIQSSNVKCCQIENIAINVSSTSAIFSETCLLYLIRLHAISVAEHSSLASLAKPINIHTSTCLIP